MTKIKSIILILFGVTLVICQPAICQEANQWPKRTTGISVVGSTYGPQINAVNLNFDQNFLRSNGLWGYTVGLTGISFGAIPGHRSNMVGVHFTLDRMSDFDDNHFESKIGGMVTNKPIIDEFFGPNKHDKRIGFLPIFSIGYRFQKPAGGMFYRVAVSTAGLGIGLGYAYPPKKKEVKS